MAPTQDLHDYSSASGKFQWLVSRIRWSYVLAALGVVALVTALTFIGVNLAQGSGASTERPILKSEVLGNVLKSTGNAPADVPSAPSQARLGAAPASTEEKLVLIDTDAGIDDAWAIFLCIQAHKNPDIPFRIVGITTNFGNTGVDNVGVNVARILKTADAEDIPVFRGSDTALVLPIHLNYTRFVGLDGFGDAGVPKVQPVLQEEHAAIGIIKLVEQYRNKLNILAIGPLTNLATALRLKPAIKSMVKSLTIMGGNYRGKDDEYRGDARADFNFLSDVEAAYVVLGNFAPTPVSLIPTETGRQAKINCVAKFYGIGTVPTKTYRQDNIATLGTSIVALLNRIEAFSLRKCTEWWYAPDSVAAAILLQPSISLQRESIHATVELRGNGRGTVTVLDERAKATIQQSPNVQVTTVLDLDLFRRMLVWTAGGPFYNNVETPESQ